jgi:hypothetical protein
LITPEVAKHQLFSPPIHTQQTIRPSASSAMLLQSQPGPSTMSVPALRNLLDSERRCLTPMNRSLGAVTLAFPHASGRRQAEAVHLLVRNERDIFVHEQSNYLPSK